MLSIVRVRTGFQDIEVIWNHVIEHRRKLQEELGDKGKLVYATKRARHEDTSLFICADDIDTIGGFVARSVGNIAHADDLWTVHLMSPRFFHMPSGTPRDLKRFSITVKVCPNRCKEVYDAIARISPTPEFVVSYLAYTFHLFTDSIMVSVMARSDEALGPFIRGNIRSLAGVTGTQISLIKKTQLLVSPEEWKEFAKNHRVPEGWEDRPRIDMSDA